MRARNWLPALALLVCLGACRSGSTIVFDSTTTPGRLALRPTTTTPTSPSTRPSSSPAPMTTTTEADDGDTDTDPDPDATSPPTTLSDLAMSQIVDTPLTAVPQMGADPVQGSGCGLTEDFADSIADGVWLGYVRPSENSLTLDVVCAFFGDAAIERGATDEADQAFFPQNSTTRLSRTEVTADEMVARRGAIVDGVCVDPGPDGNVPWADLIDDDIFAWVTVEDGHATTLVTLCP